MAGQSPSHSGSHEQMSPSGASAGKKPTDGPSHSCIRTEEAAILEGTDASLFHIEINLKHLLRDETRKHDQVLKQYYRMTREVDNR